MMQPDSGVLLGVLSLQRLLLGCFMGPVSHVDQRFGSGVEGVAVLFGFNGCFGGRELISLEASSGEDFWKSDG